MALSKSTYRSCMVDMVAYLATHIEVASNLFFLILPRQRLTAFRPPVPLFFPFAYREATMTATLPERYANLVERHRSGSLRRPKNITRSERIVHSSLSADVFAALSGMCLSKAMNLVRERLRHGALFYYRRSRYTLAGSVRWGSVTK